MTIKSLEEYSDIKREISDLDRRIEQHERKKASDTVKGSPDFPYAKRTIVVRGISHRDATEAAELRRLRSEQRDRLVAKELEIETFLDSIADSKVRQIIRLRYIDGLSWRATANRVYEQPCEDSPRKRVERFLNKK